VQAVVAAVTAAQKVPEVAGVAQVQATPPTETGVVNRGSAGCGAYCWSAAKGGCTAGGG
jgi:hypothetical protein